MEPPTSPVTSIFMSPAKRRQVKRIYIYTWCSFAFIWLITGLTIVAFPGIRLILLPIGFLAIVASNASCLIQIHYFTKGQYQQE
jgi:hypothetical protein